MNWTTAERARLSELRSNVENDLFMDLTDDLEPSDSELLEAWTEMEKLLERAIDKAREAIQLLEAHEEE